jgi:hypothetical protein
MHNRLSSPHYPTRRRRPIVGLTDSSGITPLQLGKLTAISHVHRVTPERMATILASVGAPSLERVNRGQYVAVIDAIEGRGM